MTYDDETAARFVDVVRRVLAPGGVAVVGTKAFYFGTSGGLDSLLARCCRRGDGGAAAAAACGCGGLHVLCQSPPIGGQSDMLRFVVCWIK